MAIIGKLRNQSTFIMLIVGLALLAFVLGDFFKKNSGSNRDENVGKIAGEEIPYKVFDQKVEESSENYKEKTGQTTLEQDIVDQLRQQTWNDFIYDLVIQKEFEKLGVAVNKAELTDMIIGRNPHKFLVNYFTNPKTGRIYDGYMNPVTGQLDVANINNYIKAIKAGTDENAKKAYAMYLDLEQAIKKDRVNQKYFNLVQQGLYVTTLEAKKYFEFSNEAVKFRFVSKNYSTIPDLNVKFNDDDIKDYYDKHKEDYKVEKETRGLEYIVFNIDPSKEDTTEIKTWINNIKTDFEKTKDNSILVDRESDTKFVDKFIKKEELSPILDSIIDKTSINAIIGPYIDNGAYKLTKLVDVQQRPDSIKAQHILISFAGVVPEIKRTKDEAKKLADSLLVVLKANTKIFNQMAMKISDDPGSKEKGGDLGWFPDGAMVKEFSETCNKAKIGELNIVETMYGYHIIQVLEKTKLIKKYKIATIDRMITPSKKTYDMVYEKVALFAGENNTDSLFKKSAQKQGLNIRLMEELLPDQKNIPGLDNPRQLIRWAFEAEKGKVSEIFELGTKYVIATLTDIREKGYDPIERVKKEIEVEVIKDKKAEKLTADFNTVLGTTKDIQQVAEKMKEQVNAIDKLSFMENYVAGAGNEFELIGNLFALDAGKISKPIKGRQGVYVAIVDSITKAPKVGDYSMQKMQLASNRQQRVLYELLDALQDKADIVDNRYKFY